MICDEPGGTYDPEEQQEEEQEKSCIDLEKRPHQYLG
jgi:hypothetical protein